MRTRALYLVIPLLLMSPLAFSQESNLAVGTNDRMNMRGAASPVFTESKIA
jgi:hypothetical protein